jgi:carbon-monoxide dehydrogenase medium subunit
MIPSAFDYLRPSTVEDALAALTDAGDDGKVLAGGQSLLPVLRLRLNAPALIVDLGGLEQLRGIRAVGDDIVIGAMTTHAEVAASELLATAAPLVAEAARGIGDRQVRHRGTFGGSLAHADPAGDLPTVALTLDATMIVAGPNGRREIAARDFFTAFFTTALAPNEILTEVRIPRHDGWGVHYAKLHRTSQAWATVGVAAAVRHSGGQVTDARVGLTNMAGTPLRASGVEAALTGGASPAEAAARATENTAAPTDIAASADYRNHMARVLTKRALAAAMAN